MKLLNSQPTPLTDDEVEMTVKPVTTAQQSWLGDIMFTPGFQAREAQTRYCLMNMVETLKISGEAHDPKELGKAEIDFADKGTRSVFIKIGHMVTATAWPQGDDVKK